MAVHKCQEKNVQTLNYPKYSQPTNMPKAGK